MGTILSSPSMSCDTNNATPPSPAIAPAAPGTPAAADLNPHAVAADLVARFGPTGMDPRVRALVPDFDAPFFQAGLAGYSDAAMRIIARRHGCPFCVTEALLDRTLLAGGRGFAKADLGEIEDNIPGGADDHPLAGQIMGSDPAEMAAAAIKMVEQAARRETEYRAMASSKDEAAKRQRDERRRDEVGEARPASHSVSASLRLSVSSFSSIDINLACPVKKIAKKARGGHWLAQPQGAIAILEAVREAVPPQVLVTVKMRRSFDDTQEMADNFDRIFDAAYDIGCAWVTVHARSVQQKYLGPSRWDLLRDIVARKGHGRIIFGSGDIWNAEDVFRMIAYCSVASVSNRRASVPPASNRRPDRHAPEAHATISPPPSPTGEVAEPSRPEGAFPDFDQGAPRLSGVSIARGCIGNPWIFRQCRDILAGRPPRTPTLAEQRAVLLDHFDLANRVNQLFTRGEGATRDERAEHHTARTMRKFGIRFAEHHPQGQTVRRRFIACQTLADWRQVLADHYDSEPAHDQQPVH